MNGIIFRQKSHHNRRHNLQAVHLDQSFSSNSHKLKSSDPVIRYLCCRSVHVFPVPHTRSPPVTDANTKRTRQLTLWPVAIYSCDRAPEDNTQIQASLTFNTVTRQQSFLICFISRSKECYYESRFANVWSQLEQIWVIFTHLKLWIAVARHNFKRVKIQIIYFCDVKVNPLDSFKAKMH